MTLADLASISGIVSSLAVCGTLIYLALQIRQTDRNQRTLLQQGASARNMESVWKFGEPHNADVVARVWKGETDFTDTQATQLTYLLRASLLGFQDQFLLNKMSLVHSTQNDTQERAIRRVLSAPAFRALWTITAAGYAPEFASYINALLKDAPLAFQDYAAQISAVGAELKAADVRRA
jgi:hypothetical protein